MHTSGLRMYSLGYVAKDIEEDDLYLTVYPVEAIPEHTGDLDITETETMTTKDIDGNITSTSLDKSVTIIAKWFNLNCPNRVTPPNVCIGETVMIWKYGTSDRYFWSSFYNELNLRKKEKATWVFSNREKRDDESKIKNAYYWTIDTINKFLRLHTDDGDTEYTSYDAEINSKDGIFILQDGKGNLIELESKKDNWTIKANKNIDIIAGKDVTVTAKRTLGIETDKSIIVITPDIKMDVGNKIDIALKKLSIKNSTAELIETLSDTIQAVIDIQHIGNLGIPTSIFPASKTKLSALKDKIDSFK